MHGTIREMRGSVSFAWEDKGNEGEDGGKRLSFKVGGPGSRARRRLAGSRWAGSPKNRQPPESPPSAVAPPDEGLRGLA